MILKRLGLTSRAQRMSLSLIALALAAVILVLQGEDGGPRDATAAPSDEVAAAPGIELSPKPTTAAAGQKVARAKTREEAVAQAVRWLKGQEGGKHRGHAIARHVGKSDRALRDRLARDGKSIASGFYDIETAAVAIVRTIRHGPNDQRIKRWLNDDESRRRLAVRRAFDKSIGRIVYRGGDARDGKTAVAVLTKWRTRDKTSYRLLTAYVEP